MWWFNHDIYWYEIGSLPALINGEFTNICIYIYIYVFVSVYVRVWGCNQILTDGFLIGGFKCMNFQSFWDVCPKHVSCLFPFPELKSA